MAFELAADVAVPPTGTTVAAYKVSRLGKSASIRIEFAETVEAGVNDLGVTAQMATKGGRRWELVLSTGSENDKNLILGIMGQVMFTIVKSALVAMGDEQYSDEQIMGVLSQIENLDSVIATACENVEKQRRAGTIGVMAAGDAPAAIAIMEPSEPEASPPAPDPIPSNQL